MKNEVCVALGTRSKIFRIISFAVLFIDELGVMHYIKNAPIA